MADDLSSIEGLADKHLRALARQHVTDLRGLVQADRRVIYRAMANLRPRPTLELISRWQDEARSTLDEAVTDTSDWHTAASFVVVFGQRQRGRQPGNAASRWSGPKSSRNAIPRCGPAGTAPPSVPG